MPSEYGRQFNWYHRYWHDWPEIEDTVFDVAIAHARYLGYEISRTAGSETPPGDLTQVGPVMRIRLLVYRSQKRHAQPLFELIYVDVERRAGKLRPKGAGVLGEPAADAYNWGEDRAT